MTAGAWTRRTSRVKGKWRYLYRAVDSTVATLDFLLSAKQDAAAAKRFLAKALGVANHPAPRVINPDGHAAYPPAAANAVRTVDDPTRALWQCTGLFKRLHQNPAGARNQSAEGGRLDQMWGTIIAGSCVCWHGRFVYVFMS